MYAPKPAIVPLSARVCGSSRYTDLAVTLQVELLP